MIIKFVQESKYWNLYINIKLHKVDLHTDSISVLISRDITLSTKVGLVQAMVFPVVMYGCASWTIKDVEHWRIDAFELWWWRHLWVPWTARRSNPSILKEISPEYSLEGLMLKLKQQLGHLMRRTDSLEKTLMLGKIEGRKRRGRQRGWQRMTAGGHHRLNGHEFEQAPGVGNGEGSLACCSPWGCKESDTTEWLNWTERSRKVFWEPDAWDFSLRPVWHRGEIVGNRVGGTGTFCSFHS